jgi:hypothetical protein
MQLCTHLRKANTSIKKNKRKQIEKGFTGGDWWRQKRVAMRAGLRPLCETRVPTNTIWRANDVRLECRSFPTPNPSTLAL